MDSKQVFNKNNQASLPTAARLRTKSEDIIEVWKNRAKVEVVAAKEMTQSALINSLPQFINRLAEALDEENFISITHVKEVSHKHASHRVSTGKYSIEQVIKEYQILREVILNALEDISPIQTVERNIVLKAIDMGIDEAATEYIKLRSTEEVRNRKHQLVQYEITKILSESTSNEDRSLKILDTIGKNLDWDFGMYWEVDDKSQHAKCLQEWHSPNMEISNEVSMCGSFSFPRGSGLPGRVWKSGQPCWIKDINLDANFQRRDLAVITGLKSAFGFPVFADDNIIGIIEFFSLNFRELEDDLLQVMTVLGGQIGQFTKRKRAELLVLKEETRRGATLQIALDCIISMDANGKILEFNPASEKTFGYNRSEVLGKDLAELIIPPEYRERHRIGLARYLSTGESHYMGKRLNFPAMIKGGSLIQIELAITEIPGSVPPIFTGFIRDITARVQAENKLREQVEETVLEKQKFESLFKESPASMALLKGSSHIFEKINKLYAELIGNRDVIGKTILEALPEVEKQSYIDILDNVFLTGNPFYGKESAIELRRTANGPLERRYLDFTYLRINDSKGRPYGVLAHAIDVTEKIISRRIIQEANEALKQSEKQLRNFIEAMPHMAFIADTEGSITYYNQRFYDYIGMGKETEGWGWKDQPIQHPDDLERTIQTWTKSIRTGEPYQIEYRLRRHDDIYRWHLGRAVPIKNDEGQIIRWFGTNTDIDDQKRVVNELEKERAVREQFVATLTHDLRNPLAAVKTSAQMVMRSPDKPLIRERAMSRIISAVDRSDEMIKNLLDANLIQAGKSLPLQMQLCDLSLIAEEIIEEQKVVHGNRFFLKTKRPLRGLWSCEGIRRIIDNLIGNAVKYGDTEKEISLILEDKSDHIVLSVHNFGNPIPPDDQKTLFEAFTRSNAAERSQTKGWGLGLTLVRGIAEAHGGSISLVSNFEEGTTFMVVIPKNRDF